ncbi:Protein PNS1 [Abortiporus biennis]
MAASFAAYASQFLTRQQSGGASSNGHETDLDDFDDPHLRQGSEHMSRHTVRESRDLEMGEDDDDPYLRLDEEEPGMSRHQSTTRPLLGLSSPDASKGWLAHASPLRSPSPSHHSDSSLDSRSPPPNILSPPLTPPAQRSQPPPPPRAETTLSLTESLLPRDGRTRPVDVFSLPDPRYVPRGRRKFNDSIWTAIWCTCVSVCVFCSILILFLSHKPTDRPRHPLAYTTLLHTVPLLTILIVLSACVSYAHIFLLRIFVKPVMIGTSVFVPATLFISALWAFIGSFMWDSDQEPTWGETVGLRLFSIIPLVLCVLTARRLVHLPREIHTASSLLNLTTRILMANPFLLALSPAVLLAALVASIPFITLAFRLLLIGYTSRDPTGVEFHVHKWANWAIAGTIGVWLWSWGVARGLLRVACAGVIGAWYYADPVLPPPPPTSTHTIHAALMRAAQPSLGSIVLSALIVTSIRLLGLITIGLRALPAYLPPYMRFVSVGATMAVAYLETVTSTLSTYGLVYVGLTGDSFMPSTRRTRALTGAVESSSLSRYRRKFKTEPPLTMLTVAPLTLTFPFALGTYLFVAHTLNAPDQALSAAILAGGVTALVGLFSVGLVKDTADTMYICYCIDKDMGVRHREEVFDAFEYESRHRPPPAQQVSPPIVQHQASQPRQPLSPQASHMFLNKPTPSRPPLEPRRTSQLTSPPPREPTPDPFEDSPLDDHDPYSPRSSREISNSRSQMRSQRGPVESMQLSPLRESAALPGSEDEGEESQLFPGSDLF